MGSGGPIFGQKAKRLYPQLHCIIQLIGEHTHEVILTDTHTHKHPEEEKLTQSNYTLSPNSINFPLKTLGK